MKVPLLITLMETLRKGYKRFNSENQEKVRTFVESQRRDEGYVNPGGKVEDYYTQFGHLLEVVFSPVRLMRYGLSLKVEESMNQENAYGIFFRFIKDEMRLRRPSRVDWTNVSLDTTNAVCCYLAVQHQLGENPDSQLLEWLLSQQEDNGGFRANAQAPIPDILSTAVSLFTLRLLGQEPHNGNATEFIAAHYADDNGGFCPTIFDDYSDVEYVFYGLLGLGSCI